MESTVRPYLTAGLAMAAAGAVAFAPLALPRDVQIAAPQPVNTSVELTAASDVLNRWVEMVNTTSANATKVADFAFEAPGAVLQQAMVNQLGYLGDVLNDPASIGEVFQGIGANLQKAFQTATLQGFSENDLFGMVSQSNDGWHSLLAVVIPQMLPEGTPEFVGPLINFLASPLSGVLISLVGPMVSPAVAALNSILAGDLLNLPANVVDGFFNGATLNLDGLVPVISGAGILPEGTTINRLGISFGGLLSPGATGGPDESTNGVGGSIFNSLDLSVTTDAMGFPLDIDAVGQPLGPIAALANLSQMVAKALGWDGTGNPLTDLTFPKVETESDSAATSLLAAKEVPAGPAALPSADTATTVKTLSVRAVDTSTVERSSDIEVTEKVDTATGKVTGASTGKVVRDSAKAVPGKAGTASEKAGGKLNGAADSVGNQVNSTVKKISDGLKSTFAKPAKKAGDTSSAKADASGAASGDSASGGSDGGSDK